MTGLSLQEIINRVRAWPPVCQLDFEQQVKAMAKRSTFHSATNFVYRQMETELTEERYRGF